MLKWALRMRPSSHSCTWIICWQLANAYVLTQFNCCFFKTWWWCCDPEMEVVWNETMPLLEDLRQPARVRANIFDVSLMSRQGRTNMITEWRKLMMRYSWSICANTHLWFLRLPLIDWLRRDPWWSSPPPRPLPSSPNVIVISVGCQNTVISISFGPDTKLWICFRSCNGFLRFLSNLTFTL